MGDRSHDSLSHRLWRRIDTFASRRAGAAPHLVEVPEQTPKAVLDLLRHLGVALCAAGEPVDRITLVLDRVAAVYGARGVSFFVLPTGVFVRIQLEETTQIDFAPVGGSAALRLDQIDALYRLVDDIGKGLLATDEASTRLAALLASRARSGLVRRAIGTSLLTLGLGLVMNPAPQALPVYVLLGLVVAVLRFWGERNDLVMIMLPVVTAFAVTWGAFALSASVLGARAIDIVIPSLVPLLPGAALTTGTIELSAGSMIAGTSRLVFGLERLLLLSFGIAVGVQFAGNPPDLAALHDPLGPWAPWLGVLLTGVGHYLASSAPSGTLGWLLVVLYVAYAVQAVVAGVIGALGASFVAAAVVYPVAFFVQSRRSGPPAQVTFLPAFWLLVPGALGLQGVTELVGADKISGLGDFLNALLTIVAIALGVLVGEAVAERRSPRPASSRGL